MKRENMTGNASRRISFLPLDFWAETWIGFVVLILLSCSFLSLFSLLRVGAGIGTALALVWMGFRIRRVGWSVFGIPRFRGIGCGIPILLALVLVSLLAGPHCFLDSYSYRIPQMFFWLQEGHPWSVPNVDMRINQMPHVWPMLSTAFYLPLGERALALPNYLSLLLLASLFRHWAQRSIKDVQKADAVALVFLSAPVFLMGGTTNDNVVTCVTFLALSLHFAEQFGTLSSTTSTTEHTEYTESYPNRITRAVQRAEGSVKSQANRRRTLALSAIAFALCCGIKPQYLVLAPLWGLWFLFAPSRPWKSASLRFLAVLLPVLLLCSPVPTFAVNQLCWGSYSSPWVVDSEDPQPRQAWTAPRPPVSRSFTALVNAMVSPPVNPAFSIINQSIETGTGVFARTLRSQEVTARPFAIAEGASFGFWTFLAFVVGLMMMLRKPSRDTNACRPLSFPPSSPIALIPLAILPLLLLAIWQTRAGTLGRSFIGFFLLMVPCSMMGLARFSKRALALWALWCAVNGCAAVVLDPAKPLWPVEAAIRRVAGRPTLAKQLSDYARYARRQDGPDALLAAIPATESRIGIVVEAGEPIADLWLRRKPGTTILPYPRTLSADRLRADGVRFLIVKDNGLRRHFGTDEWMDALMAQTGTHLLAQTETVTYIAKGPETWRLFEVSGE